MEGFTGTQMSKTVLELADKCVMYGVTITWSVFAIPSNLLFMACFAPSRYESKLWDLKKKLENVNDTNRSAIGEEFKDLKLRYWGHTSGPFGRLLVILSEKSTSKGKTRWDMLDERYMYYTRAAVDWELIRVQPLRYVWNETDQIALYGLAATLGFGFSGIIGQGIVKDPDRLKAIEHIKKTLSRSRSYQACKRGALHVWNWRHVQTIYVKVIKRLPTPLLFFNAINFALMFGNYKPASVDDKK